ncbi:MAG: phosphotransferase, partial [Myxococcota bacterium]
MFGIEAELSALPGEFDLNFIARASNGDLSVLKVHHADASFEQVEMQVRALQHIMAQAPVPQVCPTNDGQSIARFVDPSGRERLAWRTTFLPGRLYAEVRPHSLDLIRDLGAAIGRLHRALETFDHAALDRD